MGLNIAGVDLLRSNHGPVVMEVNSSPGLEGVEKATGLDIAGKIIEFMGGYGYSFEYQVEKYYRDIKIVTQGLGGPQRDPMDTIRSYYPFSWGC